MPTPNLFEPLTIKDIQLKNRIIVSPMCQYSSIDGFANDWHFVHLSSRAVGGAAVVFTEASAVSPEGRISPQDLGIWSDEHIPALTNITRFIESQGAIPGMQIAHAGRKGSTKRPWDEHNDTIEVSEGGWQPVAPSAIEFSATYPKPRALTISEIDNIILQFAQSAKRVLKAGFKILEIHAAHGYLFHEFLSPLSNHRQDQYGGSFDNRARLLLEVVDAINSEWPNNLPLFVRISATDWAQGGWDIDQSVALSKLLKTKGVDLIDTSSGGMIPHPTIPLGPGYQTPFAQRIKKEAGIATGAVGLIISPFQADHIIRTEQADLVMLAREMLRNPYWPLQAARELNQDIEWPVQYQRAKQR